MATPVVFYTRGTTYVSNVSKGQTYYALIGTLTAPGLEFDSLENFDLNINYVDTVHLKPRDYPSAIMYFHSRLKCYVINPWNGTGPGIQENEILVHSGSVPSDFEGCIGPGLMAV